jgi:hypothetical protein
MGVKRFWKGHHFTLLGVGKRWVEVTLQTIFILPGFVPGNS